MKTRSKMLVGSVLVLVGFLGLLIWLGVLPGLSRETDHQPIVIRPTEPAADQSGGTVGFVISNQTSSSYVLLNVATETLTNGHSSIKEWPRFTLGGESMQPLGAHEVVTYSLTPDQNHSTRVRLAFVKFLPRWLSRVDEPMRRVGINLETLRNGEIAGPVVPAGTNSSARVRERDH